MRNYYVDRNKITHCGKYLEEQTEVLSLESQSFGDAQPAASPTPEPPPGLYKIYSPGPLYHLPKLIRIKGHVLFKNI